MPRAVMLVAMGDLFTSLPQTEEVRDVAFIGYYDGSAGLAQGFAEAAEAIYASWCAAHNPAQDRLLPPLAYNYRHALELVLKQAIRQAVACARFAGTDAPGLLPADLEMHFKKKQGHRLGPLATQLAGLLKELDIEELPADVTLMLARLHQLDPTGEAFRYTEQLKTDARHVNVGPLVELFRDTFDLLHGGVLTMLDQYADYQREMWEEYRGYASDGL